MLVLPPVWAAAPPEVHSTLLNFGGTPAGIAAAGTSWTQLAAQYAAGIAELEGILAQVQAQYQGPSAEQFVAAHQPMLLWMADVFAKSLIAASAHSEVVAAYEGSVVAMPTLGELAENHIVHGVLVSTNFFGVNTIPIGMNEADYIRMWNLAADVMAGWDGASTAAADSVPLTPTSPILLLPGVGESGAAAASAASFWTQAEGQAAGAALNGADMMGTKLLVGKAATSPASAADGAAPSPSQAENASRDDLAQQGLKPENMASSMLQQMTSIGPSAAQSVASAAQGAGPQQLLSSAPQMLSSAPQQLGQLLTQFTGAGSGAGQQTSAMPVGFAGTSAIKGINPAGLTSLAGGAFGSGPSKPLLPSTWGAPATTAAESLTNSARGLTPLAAGLPGAAASGSGAGGGAMMGSGAHNTRRSGSQRVNTYADDAVDEDADSDGGRSP